MRLVKKILVTLAALLLAGAACVARADETGCQAVITTLAGQKIQVSDFAARMMEDSFPGTELMVFYEGGQSIMDLAKLRGLTRLAPKGEACQGQKVEFSFHIRDGQTGKFKIWAEYIFSGQTALGAWSERAARIKRIVVNCPPPIPGPPASTD